MITKEDVLDYAKIYGNEAAMNLLLLAGPDGYKGTINEYEELQEDLA